MVEHLIGNEKLEDHVAWVSGMEVDITYASPPPDELDTGMLRLLMGGHRILGAYIAHKDLIRIHPTCALPCTVYHELAHWTGHPSRLARPFAVTCLEEAGVDIDSPLIMEEELVAVQVEHLFAVRYELQLYKDHGQPGKWVPEAHVAFEYLVDELGL